MRVVSACEEVGTVGNECNLGAVNGVYMDVGFLFGYAVGVVVEWFVGAYGACDDVIV